MYIHLSMDFCNGSYLKLDDRGSVLIERLFGLVNHNMDTMKAQVVSQDKQNGKCSTLKVYFVCLFVWKFFGKLGFSVGALFCFYLKRMPDRKIKRPVLLG